MKPQGIACSNLDRPARREIAHVVLSPETRRAPEVAIGLRAYVVTQRTREFGIRLALGAETANLKSIVLREALLLAGAGLLFGVVGALAVTRLISSFLVGVTTADPASMGVGITTVIGATLAAAYVPARRAVRADPVVAMRAV